MFQRKQKLAITFALGGALVAAVMGMKALAGEPRSQAMPGQEATLEGRVVDLHDFMIAGTEPADHAKSTAECIRAGVPAALETSSGLVLIGEGAKSPSSQLAPFALEKVKIAGKLYEREGVRYIDMRKIEKEPTQTSSAAKTKP